ncbi:hypothetical protein SAMN04487761_10124 [Lachnospiraceae bacterium C7]|nr:hypothetical protein SAMN04487761_10124 [Lachnospiraceae bacterium C7]
MRMSNGVGALQATYGYCYNNGVLSVDLNGMWPNPVKWVKNKAKKAAKAVGGAVNKAGKAWNKFYTKNKDVVNIVGGIAVIGAGTVLAPLVGASAAAVAISGTTAAVIGGLSNMTTGGSFSDGFLGEAVNGTIFSILSNYFFDEKSKEKVGTVECN